MVQNSLLFFLTSHNCDWEVGITEKEKSRLKEVDFRISLTIKYFELLLACEHELKVLLTLSKVLFHTAKNTFWMLFWRFSESVFGFKNIFEVFSGKVAAAIGSCRLHFSARLNSSWSMPQISIQPPYSYDFHPGSLYIYHNKVKYLYLEFEFKIIIWGTEIIKKKFYFTL